MLRSFKIVPAGFIFLTAIFLFSPGCSDQRITDNGFLEGKISIGPLCPVEKDPPDPGCLPTADTYKAFPVGVWTAGGRRKVTRLDPAPPDGIYLTALAPGTYLVRLDNNGNFPGSANLPVEINVSPGKITLLDINIDTGIR